MKIEKLLYFERNAMKKEKTRPKGKGKGEKREETKPTESR